MNNSVMVSVILLIQQESPYLTECIDSIVSQRFDDWELICIVREHDKESQDKIRMYMEAGQTYLHNIPETDGVMRAYMRQTGCSVNKIRMITGNDFRGISEAVNYSMKTACGRYLMLLHPEDFCLPDYLESGVAAAEKNQAQVVVFESGERSLKTGVLRQRFISLQKQILPDREVFPSKEIKGNSLRLVRFPSWLTLFRKEYLTGLCLHFSEDCRTNDRWFGMCAIAAAERISAIREPLVYLHMGSNCFADIASEMKVVFDFLNKKNLYEKLGYQFAHSFLTDAVRGLKTANSDFQRYEILNYLCSDTFQSMGILNQPPEWYHYRVAINNCAFVVAACKRYAMIQRNSFCNKTEEIIPVRDKSEVKVSVIMPVFNSEDYLEEAIQSVAGQTLQEIEILCMDDGSTDDSFEILKKWSQQDRRIGVYRQKNAGPSVARNQLLKHARGRYILYLDSDDMLASDASEKLFRTAENEKLDLLLFNGTNFYDKNLPDVAKKVRDGQIIIKDYKGMCSGSEMLVMLQEQEELYSAVWLTFINKQFLEREDIKFHEGVLHEDTAYAFELLLKANRVDYLKTVFYKRRLRNDSITTQMKRFDHCYGSFLGYIDMYNTFRQREDHLDERAKDAARYRIQWMLDAARDRYMQMSDSFAGEEYGLREDFTAFHSLIGSYCEQLSLQKNANGELTATVSQLNVFRNSLKETKDKLGHTETQLQETKGKLDHTETLLQETKDKLDHTETLLQETRGKLGHTETQLQETRGKLGHTETQLKETKIKLGHTETQLKETKGKLGHAEIQLQETEKHLRSTANRLDGALEEISCLKNSVSFRLGRGLTWPLRKLREWFRFSN